MRTLQVPAQVLEELYPALMLQPIALAFSIPSPRESRPLVKFASNLGGMVEEWGKWAMGCMPAGGADTQHDGSEVVQQPRQQLAAAAIPLSWAGMRGRQRPLPQQRSVCSCPHLRRCTRWCAA